MTKKRLNEILNKCLTYILELKKHTQPEELHSFFKNVLGLTDEEIKLLDIEE